MREKQMQRSLCRLMSSEKLRDDESTVKQFLISAALEEVGAMRHFIEGLGVHPDATYSGKPTALCYAALKQNCCLMRYLHIHGADVNSVDQLGMAPIHYAALGGSCFCVSYLIHSGADVNKENNLGETALSLSMKKSHLAECEQFLRAHGARLKQGDLQASRFH